MNIMKNIGSLTGGTAVVASVIGLTAGVAPASAAPQASPGVTVAYSRDPANDAYSILSIRGTFPMSEGAAYDRLNHMGPGGGMDYIIYGDDPGEADVPRGNPHGFPGRPGPPGGAVLATPNGLTFYRDIRVSRGDLDEDFCFSSGCADDVDEIYVKVRFVPGNGAGDLRANTNVVSGRFGD